MSLLGITKIIFKYIYTYSILGFVALKSNEGILLIYLWYDEWCILIEFIATTIQG